MFRALRRWALRVGLLAFLLWVAFSSGYVSMAFGYGLLLWLIVRAAPGCAADLRALRSLAAPYLGSRVRLSDSNAGF